ncbi:MAG: hypothetical protein O3A51_06930 [Verrucomicrobia bacterium]|nr:hypothetical protein [Verrucomicrobiota bacterium]
MTLGARARLGHTAAAQDAAPPPGRTAAIADSYKIMTAVKSILQRPGDKTVGTPMSLRKAFIVWLVLLLISLAGAYDYYFGGLF